MGLEKFLSMAPKKEIRIALEAVKLPEEYCSKRKAHKMIYVADIHGNENLYKELFELARLENVDSIIMGGDILPKSSANDLINTQQKFIKNKLIPMSKKFMKENPSKTAYLMMGNDDFRVNMDLLEQGAKQGYFKLLHNNIHRLTDDFNICGYSFVPPLPFLMKDWQKHDTKKTRELSNECDKIYSKLLNCKNKDRKKLEKLYLNLLSKLGYTYHIRHYTVRGVLSVDKRGQTTIEEDLKALAKRTNPRKTIFIIHAPPWKTKLDRVYPDDTRIGSKAVKEFIEREQPLLTLHGHAHESFELSGKFMEIIGKTISINPGSEHQKKGVKLNAVIFDVYNLKKVRHTKS